MSSDHYNPEGRTRPDQVTDRAMHLQKMRRTALRYIKF